MLGLCTGDPLVEALRGTFGANIVRVPEERVQPLCVVAAQGNRTVFRGALSPLLEGSPEVQVPEGARASSRMASMENKESRSVDLGLALEILGGFLQGFNIPSASMGASFTGAKEIAFAFQGVQRNWVDTNWLGRWLSQQALDRANASTGIFFEKPVWTLLIIDSIITSNAFTVVVKKASSSEFGIQIPSIAEVVGSANAKVKVSQSGQRQVTFTGPEPLTFAFSTVVAHLSPDGAIVSLPPDDTSRVLKVIPVGRAEVPPFTQIEILDSPGMIEFEEFNPPN